MNKPVLLTSCLVAAGALLSIAYFYPHIEDSSVEKSMFSIPDKETNEPTANIGDINQTKNHKSEQNDPKVVNDITASASNSSGLGGNIWSRSNNSSSAPAQYSHLSDDGVNRSYIEIERSEIEALNKGSDFNVTIPSSSNQYNAKVHDIIYHPNGDKTVKATIKSDDGEKHSITITQGQNSTFAALSTPEGAYVLEAGETSGWIASEDDLAQSQDRSVTDEVYLTPDESDVPPS